MRVHLLAGLLGLAAGPVYGGVEVRIVGDRVSLHADQAPVSEILDNLARQTGMRLSYDAAPPRQALSATLENRTPAEVVLSVLEGLGLNYALVMDRAGTRVEQLLILGTSMASAAPARPTPSSPAGRAAPAQIPDFVQETDGDDTDADSSLDPMEVLGQMEAEEAAGQTTPAPTAPPSLGPRPPEYPSSPFSPRLPLPSPPPPASPQPTPAPPKSQ